MSAPDLLTATRFHARHFTVTGYVTCRERRSLLVVHHRKLGVWLPPGGHLEPNEVPHEAAIREVYEETGVRAQVEASSDPDLGLRGVRDIQIPRPFAMGYQLIHRHGDEPEHVHLDMAYALTAPHGSAVEANLSEVRDARWMTAVEILASEGVFDSVKGFARVYMN